MATPTRLPAPGQGECLDYEPGAVIYYAGHRPYGIYYVERGAIRLTGRRRRRTAGAGEILGLKACMADEAHSETALCLEPTRVYFISRRELGAPGRTAVAAAPARTR